MRVLVTGISGFTGRHLARALRAAGYEVWGLGDDDGAADNRFLKVSLAKTEVIAGWIEQIRPDYVIHLAALSHVVGDAADFYRVNVVGTESLLQAIAEAKLAPKKIVIASSANIYGNHTPGLISESDPVRPVNHYGFSKAAMELMVHNWEQRFPIIVTRPFNYTGPGQSERFVYAKIVAAFRRRDRLIRLGNIQVARDLSDVRYVVDIYRRLMEGGHSGVTVNICSGNSVSIVEAIDIMASVAGYKPEIEIDPSLIRPNEIMKISGDTAMLRSLIGELKSIDPETTFRDMYSSGFW